MWEPDRVTRRPIGVKILLPALAAVLAMTFSACGDEDPSTASDDQPTAALSLDDLDGRVFASVRVDGHRLVEDTEIRLGFEDDRVSAHAGCNHLTGVAALDQDTLNVTNLAGTEMGCPDGRNDQDTWLGTFLGAGPTVDLADKTLTLSGGDVVIELVEQEVPDPPAGDPDQPTSNDDTVVENN